MDYIESYGFKEPPFRLTPDPDFFYPSDTHNEALETLIYAIQSGEGFIQITGTPGTGKSMLLRKVLEQIKDNIVVGLILHSNIKAHELLYIIMEDFGVDLSGLTQRSREQLLTRFRDFLLTEVSDGKQVIVIVDEAQNLPDETLEELRMLSNLETEKAKLLQIILVGQLELEDKISHDRLPQLAQRITIRYRLKPLTRKETRAYIQHRLKVASDTGNLSLLVFNEKVFDRIYEYSKGIPRLINVLCERLLMAAYVDGSAQIKKMHMKKALISIEGEGAKKSTAMRNRVGAYTVGTLLLAAILIFGGMNGLNSMDFTAVIKKNFASTTMKQPETIDHPNHLVNSISTSGNNDGNEAVATHRVNDPSEKVGSKEPSLDKKSNTVNKIQPSTEEVQSDKEDAVVPPDARTIPRNNQYDWERISKACTFFPDQHGSFLLVVQDLKKAVGFSHDQERLHAEREFAIDWIYPEGGYVAGLSKERTPFIFHPALSYTKRIIINDSLFWSFISEVSDYGIVPVIVVKSVDALIGRDEHNLFKGSEKKKASSDNAVIPHFIDQIDYTFEKWGQAWNAKNIETLMACYGPLHAKYRIFPKEVETLSKEQLFLRKNASFDKNEVIHVGFKDPIYLIDPTQPTKGGVFFYQIYGSSTYRDEGIKLLYFEKMLSKTSGENEWKITGSLWVPVMDG